MSSPAADPTDLALAIELAEDAGTRTLAPSGRFIASSAFAMAVRPAVRRLDGPASRTEAIPAARDGRNAARDNTGSIGTSGGGASIPVSRSTRAFRLSAIVSPPKIARMRFSVGTKSIR